VRYRGEIYDPPQEETGLRHVAGGRTGGTIGPEGIYLHGGTAWYPVIAPMAKYSVEALLPTGWRLVAQGNRVKESEGAHAATVRWEDPVPSNALDVVAGKYVVTDAESDGVRISTYLFEEEKDFAQLYIDASKKFLAFYSDLLGPYPYQQFSVVENWFSTGYGMPSFTLLGREVVKMAQRYTGAVGLGHEIVHNWWGNGVFVDESEGNWCEGLTSYCTNYYWTEATEGPEAARLARRKLCERFTILVQPDEDFPLAEFMSKETETDNEVGYDKAAFLFHTIRRRIGDEAFWKALKAVSTGFRGRAAKWSDFGAAFQEASGEDVQPWIDAWRTTKGIPTITAKLRVTDQSVDVDLSIENPLPCVVPVFFDMDPPQTVEVTMPGSMGGAGCPKKGELKRAIVDPDFHVLRRLDPVELNPCLNRTLAAKRRVVVRPTGGDKAECEAYAGLVERLSKEDGWEVVDDS
ncbi:MAG: M1 family aminopeptidase, partial [Planctomycetota bacterium]